MKLFLTWTSGSGNFYFKRFLIYRSGGSPFQWRGTICAIFVEGIMGNTHVKLFFNLDKWFKCHLKKKSMHDG